MGGSQNMLDELRFADAWDDAHFGGRLDAKMLVEMATVNAAAVLGLADTLGRLEVGLKADIVVIERLDPDPYRAILSARPANVRMVMVGGAVLYGDPEHETLGRSGHTCEPVDVCGSPKVMCIAEHDRSDKLDQTYQVIESALAGAVADLDSIQPLGASSCNPACAAGEACFARTVHEQVAESMCPSSCAGGEACFRTAMSGDDQFNCLSVNACAPIKPKPLAPITPVVRCE
jgi:hypothetical protein